MALDSVVARELWDKRYKKELENFAFKYKHLNEFGDPQDMFQDMSINVWMKAIDNFKQESVTFTENVERAFNSFFTTILQQYIANLMKHRQTGESKYFRTNIERGDRPLKGEEGEGSTTLMDTLSDPESLPRIFQESADFEKMVNSLDPTLEQILRFIVQEYEPGGKGELWQEIRNRWGLTRNQLFNQLLEEKEFVDYVLEFD